MSAVFIASDVSVGEGALYALVGFVIVLLVLALLVGVFYLSGFLFEKNFFIKEKKPAEDEMPSEGEDDEQTVAAITAAIMMVLSEENGDDAPEFVIRRIVRK